MIVLKIFSYSLIYLFIYSNFIRNSVKPYNGKYAGVHFLVTRTAT